MTPDATIDLLRRLDRTGGQCPQEPNLLQAKAQATSQFLELCATLEQLWGVHLPIEAGDMIQDASLSALAVLTQDLLLVPLPQTQWPTLRLSNFGSLIAVDREEYLPSSTLEDIRLAGRTAGTCWVPASLHQQPYDGVCADAAGPIETWYARFFTWGYPELPDQ